MEIEQAMVAKNRGELSEEGYSACMRATAGVQNESLKELMSEYGGATGMLRLVAKVLQDSGKDGCLEAAGGKKSQMWDELTRLLSAEPPVVDPNRSLFRGFTKAGTRMIGAGTRREHDGSFDRAAIKELERQPGRAPGYPLLCWAVMHSTPGHHGGVRLMLEVKADPNVAVEDERTARQGNLHGGWSALFFAADRGDAELVQLLLQHKADPSRTARTKHINGEIGQFIESKHAKGRGFTARELMTHVRRKVSTGKMSVQELAADGHEVGTPLTLAKAHAAHEDRPNTPSNSRGGRQGYLQCVQLLEAHMARLARVREAVRLMEEQKREEEAERRAAALAEAAQRLTEAVTSATADRSNPTSLEALDAAMDAYKQLLSGGRWDVKKSAPAAPSGAEVEGEGASVGLLWSVRQLRAELVEERADRALTHALAADDLVALQEALAIYAHEASAVSLTLQRAKTRRAELASAVRAAAAAEQVQEMRRRKERLQALKAQREAENEHEAALLAGMRAAPTLLRAAHDDEPSTACGMAAAVKLKVQRDGIVKLFLRLVPEVHAPHQLLSDILAMPPPTAVERARLRSVHKFACAKAEAALRAACTRADLPSLRSAICEHAAAAGPESRTLLYAHEAARRLDRQKRHATKAEAKKERRMEASQAKSKSAEAQRVATVLLAAARERAIREGAATDELDEAIACGQRDAPASNELQHALACRDALQHGRAERLLNAAMEVDDVALLRVALEQYAPLLGSRNAVVSAARGHLEFLRASAAREERMHGLGVQLMREHTGDDEGDARCAQSEAVPEALGAESTPPTAPAPLVTPPGGSSRPLGSFADIVRGVHTFNAHGGAAVGTPENPWVQLLREGCESTLPPSVAEERAHAAMQRARSESKKRAAARQRVHWEHWEQWRMWQAWLASATVTPPYMSAAFGSLPWAPPSAEEVVIGILAWQTTFYFSDENLHADTWMTHPERLGADGTQPVPVRLIAEFPRVRQVFRSFVGIIDSSTLSFGDSSRVSLLVRAMKRVPLLRCIDEPAVGMMVQRVEPLPTTLQQPHATTTMPQPSVAAAAATSAAAPAAADVMARGKKDIDGGVPGRACAGAEHHRLADEVTGEDMGVCAVEAADFSSLLEHVGQMLEHASSDTAASAGLVVASIVNDRTAASSTTRSDETATVSLASTLEAAWGVAAKRLQQATPTSVIDTVDVAVVDAAVVDAASLDAAACLHQQHSSRRNNRAETPLTAVTTKNRNAHAAGTPMPPPPPDIVASVDSSQISTPKVVTPTRGALAAREEASPVARLQTLQHASPSLPPPDAKEVILGMLQTPRADEVQPPTKEPKSSFLRLGPSRAGLANSAGDNRCFLNVVLQSLWALFPFRRVMCAAEASPSASATDVAVLLALMEVFEGFDAEASTHAPTSHPPTSHRAWADVVADNDLDSATPTVVAPPHGGGLVDASKVQEALRDAEPGRWAVGEMHDASEALEALLDILERVVQIGGAHSRWGRQAKHRVPSLTEMFGLFTCEGAGATKAAPAVTTRSWVRHLLRSTVDAAVSSAESPSSAGSSSIAASTPAAACPALAIALRGTTPTQKAVAEPTAMSAGDWGERVLLTGTPPRVYTINLVHDTSSPSDEQIGRLLHGICDALPLQDVHPEVLGRQQRQQRAGGKAALPTYQLCALVGFGHHHYVSYAKEPQSGCWCLCDDRTLKILGSSLDDVKAHMRANVYAPTLLFYEA